MEVFFSFRKLCETRFNASVHIFPSLWSQIVKKSIPFQNILESLSKTCLFNVNSRGKVGKKEAEWRLIKTVGWI